MEEPVQWMTQQELRDELEQTRAAWQAMDLGGVCQGSAPGIEPGCPSSPGDRGRVV